MLRCSPEAFAKCPTHHYCGNYPSECTFAEGSDCHKFNQQMDKGQKTNADRIREMTDEELRKLLIEFSAFACIFPDKDCEEVSCVECVTNWLNEPVEV